MLAVLFQKEYKASENFEQYNYYNSTTVTLGIL